MLMHLSCARELIDVAVVGTVAVLLDAAAELAPHHGEHPVGSTHVGENLRGALQSLPRGQTEAAKAIGLTFPQLFVYVLAPQALRQALPAWINTATEMVKASTLLSVISVAELLLVTKQIVARTFMTLEFYMLAGLIYFLINYAIERAAKAVERRVALPS